MFIPLACVVSRILLCQEQRRKYCTFEKVITAQKDILKKNNLSDAPQVLTVYKEVEDYWHGTDKAEGLKKWDVLNDVTIMLCDDNFGNMRTLPTKEDQNRKGGYGMYYHFDYHGGPTSMNG